ncbi:hypothetical protein CcCBS67573_g06735 [Chytriomyces confervae]|uniref:Extracellular membrane protein CFEM domain-containing protein n=1 Tax=Chytriomyces confervae TaxID=246404 RepID=A0A507F188_9FUNG|nr:hypothetical protein CcCBS67573_g06735 [Chytriomyces confervae]
MQSLSILAFALAASAQVVPSLPSTPAGVAQYFSNIVPNKPACGTSCFTSVPGSTLPATVASATAFCAAYAPTFSACVAKACPASAKPDWDSLISVLPNLCQTVSGTQASSSAAASSASDAAPTDAAPTDDAAAATTTAANDSAAPVDPTSVPATDASRSSVSSASAVPKTSTAAGTKSATSAAAQKTVSATSLAAPTSIKSSADTVAAASFVLGAKDLKNLICRPAPVPPHLAQSSPLNKNPVQQLHALEPTLLEELDITDGDSHKRLLEWAPSCCRRYLTATSWRNIRSAADRLKATFQWRHEYKPDQNQKGRSRARSPLWPLIPLRLRQTRPPAPIPRPIPPPCHRQQRIRARLHSPHSCLNERLQPMPENSDQIALVIDSKDDQSLILLPKPKSIFTIRKRATNAGSGGGINILDAVHPSQLPVKYGGTLTLNTITEASCLYLITV